MAEFTKITFALEIFLKQIQEIGIIKEFATNSSELTDRNISEFKKSFQELSDKINIQLENVDKSKSLVFNSAVNEDLSRVKNTDLEKSHVQLQVDEKEIQRRISAFINRKRKEVNEWNIQEFCSRPYNEEENVAWDQIDSCARVDAVFIPRFGSKSHVKVSKVENTWGPQTHIVGNSLSNHIKRESEESCNEQAENVLEAIQERLQNMESHLNLKTDTSLRNSIFQRLKALEDRILFLEGISPDYFYISGPNYSSPKKKNNYEKEKIYSNWNVEDIQSRIQVLKESLKVKSNVQKKNSQ